MLPDCAAFHPHAYPCVPLKTCVYIYIYIYIYIHTCTYTYTYAYTYTYIYKQKRTNNVHNDNNNNKHNNTQITIKHNYRTYDVISSLQKEKNMPAAPVAPNIPATVLNFTALGRGLRQKWLRGARTCLTI